MTSSTSADQGGGYAVEVRRSPRRRRTVSAYRQGDVIVVLVPAHLTGTQERAAVSDLVAKVLAREARPRKVAGDAGLMARAEQLADAWLSPVLSAAPRPASVRWVTNQRRRWGSCTPATAEIRLSDRLQAFPDWVVDYVMLHELTHLVEGPHSPRFWQLVGRYPQTERARGYLLGYAAAQGRPAEDDDVD